MPVSMVANLIASKIHHTFLAHSLGVCKCSEEEDDVGVDCTGEESPRTTITIHPWCALVEQDLTSDPNIALCW